MTRFSVTVIFTSGGSKPERHIFDTNEAAIEFANKVRNEHHNTMIFTRPVEVKD